MKEEQEHCEKCGRFLTDTGLCYRCDCPFGTIIPGQGEPSLWTGVTIKLPDEYIPKSVGAKWINYDIALPDGSVAKFVEGSKLQDKEIFAGKGCRREIDELDNLVEKYGGHPDSWVKVKAIGEIELPNGEIQKAEIHWYEEPTVGKVKMKRKKVCK